MTCQAETQHPQSNLGQEIESMQYGQHGKSIVDFLNDSHFIRVLVGGRGTGKTFSVAEDITAHIWQNAGAKAIIARETETSQEDSSIDTFWQYFATLGDLYSTSSPYGLFRAWNNGRTFRLPSKLAVEQLIEARKDFKDSSDVEQWIKEVGDQLCGYVEFRGLPAAEKGKLRGMECSYMALVEADQLSREKFDLCLACLRWKGADADSCDEKGYIRDRCVVLDTNPPGPRHWIAQLEHEEAQKAESERRIRFWHVCTYENEHNLPDNYIRDTILLPYSDNPAMIERMLFGRYAEAYAGKPVYFAFRTADHAGDDLPWIKGAYFVRSMDFGANNSTIFSAYFLDEDGIEHWHVLSEIYMDGSDTERQAREVIRLTESDFPFWNDRDVCAGVYDYCDPAGANSNYSTAKTGSSVKILNTYGIHPGYQLWMRSIQVGLALCNRLLEKRDRNGNPCFRIDRKNAPLLYDALMGAYRYPEPGEPGYGNDVPLKGAICNNADGLADAWRYGVLNCMKLLRTEYEAPKQSNLFSGRNPNPKKRWY